MEKFRVKVKNERFSLVFSMGRGRTIANLQLTGFHPVRDKKVEKKSSLVLIYGSVESYRFIRRKKTVGVNLQIHAFTSNNKEHLV